MADILLSSILGQPTVTLTGAVTGSGSGTITSVIPNSSINLNQLTNISTATFLGRVTAGSGVIETLSASQVRTALGLVIGTDVQAYDADLSSISGLSGTSGVLRKTADNTWSLDTNTFWTSANLDTANLVRLSGVSGQVIATAASLGTTAGNSVDLFEINGTTSNNTRLVTRLYRSASGTSWTTADVELRRRVDSTDQAFIRLGGDTNGTRIVLGGGVDISPITLSTNPFRISSAASGAGRIVLHENTSTTTDSLAQYRFQVGASPASGTITTYGTESTVIPLFAGKTILENETSGIGISAYATDSDIRFFTGTSRVERVRISSSGEIIQNFSPNGFRNVNGDYGIFWRLASGIFYLMNTASGDQYGSFNSSRPFIYNLTNGNINIGDQHFIYDGTSTLFDINTALKLSGGGGSLIGYPSTGSSNTAARVSYQLAQYRQNNASTTGAIVFTAPNSSTITMMMGFHIRGYLHTPHVIDMDVRSYWNGSTWATSVKINRGTIDFDVRVGADPSGKPCLILGDVGTVWAHPHIVVDGMFSHTHAFDSNVWNWTTALVTDLSSYTALSSAISNSVAAGTGFVTSAGTDGISGNKTISGTFSHSTGINFGAATSASNSDISRHISLHTSGYGFSVTSNRLNIVASSSSSSMAVFTLSGGDAATVDQYGLSITPNSLGTNSAIRVSGAFTGNARTLISLTNTDTSVSNLAQIVLKSGATPHTGGVAVYGTEYTGVSGYGGFAELNSDQSGVQLSASGSSGIIRFLTGGTSATANLAATIGTDNTFTVNNPGSSTGQVQITGPTAVPGIVGTYSTTKRRDIRFSSDGVRILASGNTSTPGNATGLFVGEGAANGVVVGTAAMIRSSGAHMVLSCTSAGTMYMRPNGDLSTTGQATLTTAGLFTTSDFADSMGNVRDVPPTLRNAAYTLTQADSGGHTYSNNTTAYSWTLNTGLAAGWTHTFTHDGSSGTKTIVQGTSVTLIRGTTTGNVALSAGQSVTVTSLGSNRYRVYG